MTRGSEQVLSARLVRTSSSCVAFGLIFAMTNVASSHHSIFPFDMNTFVELEGVVSEKIWRNPHVRLTMLIENGSGETEEWLLEADSANAAARRGVTRDTIRIGDRVRIAGNPSNRGRRELFLTNILLPNGEERLLHDRPRPLLWTEESTEPVAASDTSLGRSIFRVWSFGSRHRPRQPYVFTPAAQAARAGWNPQTDMLAIRCIAPGMPNAMLNPYPIEFVDEGDQIRLRVEQWDATRLIDMVSGEIPEGTTPSLLGYSVGRWEEEALVVETALVDFPYLDDAGTPMSGDVQMAERFTVSADGSRLDYEVAVTDPANLVGPAIEDSSWNWIPDMEIQPYECQPE